MVSSKTIKILSAVTAILTLVSVGLTASHAVSHSYVRYKSSGLVIRTMANVSPCPTAVKVKAEDDTIEMVISCPYRPATKAIAFISLISLQFLLILNCWKLKNRVKSVIIILYGIIDFPLLLVAGIMMIVDMAHGKKQLSDMSSDYSYQPFEYIINVIFLFIGLICGALATYFVYTNRPLTHPSESNNTMSITKPHWSEGESRGNDYIKPYSRAHKDYQGGNDSLSHDTSAVSLHQNNRNTPPSPNNRGQYRRNSSNEEYPPLQARPRQQSNAGRPFGNPMNLTIETNNTNQNTNGFQNNYPNNNRMAGPPPRKNYSGSSQSSMYAKNPIPYEGGPQRSPQRNNQSQMYNNNNGPQRSPDGRSYANHGGNPKRFVSQIAANGFENGSNNRGYLDYGNEPSYQRNKKEYDDNSLDYYRPENRGRNQGNFEEGNYQRANQRNLSQNNGNNIPYNINYNEKRRSPSQNYNYNGGIY